MYLRRERLSREDAPVGTTTPFGRVLPNITHERQTLTRPPLSQNTLYTIKSVITKQDAVKSQERFFHAEGRLPERDSESRTATAPGPDSVPATTRPYALLTCFGERNVSKGR
jgi:hypothetical protein